MSNVVDTIVVTTTPVTYGLGGMVYFGMPVSDWIIVGTLVLLVVNITWGGLKLYDRFKNNK
jgi:hypothetical protein